MNQINLGPENLIIYLVTLLKFITNYHHFQVSKISYD